VSRQTGKETDGFNVSRERWDNHPTHGGQSAHYTHYSDDGKGNSERTSHDISPSKSGGWNVNDSHSNKQ
jgi:hypothetical protein